MELKTFCYHQESGWNVAELPKVDATHQLVVVFGAPEFRDTPAPLSELNEAYPNAAKIGCSTSGEIFGTSVADKSLSVAVIGFATTEVKTVHIPISEMTHSFQTGEAIGTALQESDKHLRGVLVLSDGLNVNGSELVRGLNRALPEEVTVTGGLAGDGPRFEQTWVWKDGTPESGFVSAVGFYGEHVSIGHGSQGGWDKFGPERRVTRSDHNILYSLDDKPALALYKEYLGERAAELPASGLLFPLALLDEDNDKMLVRTILAVDEEEQSLTFAGDLPEGSKVRLMKANLDRLVQGAEDAATTTTARSPGHQNGLAIAISCVGRRLVLGERIEDEIEETLEALPPGTQQIGFYSYGEISPFSTGAADLHNQTMTITTIYEKTS